jgi:transcription factor TGA
MRADSGQQQEVLMVTVDDYNYEQGLGVAATTAPIFQQHTEGQDKVIVT